MSQISHKRTIIYALVLIAVATGHYFAQQLSLEMSAKMLGETRQMSGFLCLIGGIILLLRPKTEGDGRARKMFTFLLLVTGTLKVALYIRGLVFDNGALVVYQHSMPLLIYASLVVFFFFLYAVEALRPGWLTFRRALLIFSPIVILPIGFSLTSWMWLNTLLIGYPVLGLLLMLRYRRNYEEWCKNNYASLKHIDILWLNDFIFCFFVLTISYVFSMFLYNVQSGFMHAILFLVFYPYATYRMLFRKNPYPEGFFKKSMNEDMNEESMDEATIENMDDAKTSSPFSNKIPEYKATLEHWMQTEKPYLNADFKLLDVGNVLPLNRSYLSRLFNEGYGESFYEFVMRYRIIESKDLLLSRPDLNISDVADLSGFSSLSMFSRSFKQAVGLTPKQWRDNQNFSN
jgi:AraC-like DNA-binding protein